MYLTTMGGQMGDLNVRYPIIRSRDKPIVATSQGGTLMVSGVGPSRCTFRSVPPDRAHRGSSRAAMPYDSVRKHLQTDAKEEPP